MDKAQKLLKLAREQPNTTGGFIRSVFYGCLALQVVELRSSCEKNKG